MKIFTETIEWIVETIISILLAFIIGFGGATIFLFCIEVFKYMFL